MPGESTATVLPHVYRLSPLRRVILDGVAVALLALPAGILIANPMAIGVAGLIFLCLLPTLFILLFTAWYPRLTVSSEGIRVRGAIGYSSLLIPWNDIERVSLRANKEGLILHQPLESRAAARWKNWSGVRFFGSSMFDDEQQRYINQQRYVPIQIFAYWLRHADLATEIAGYAPALAEGLQAQEAGYRKEQSKANRTILWLFAITLLICAGTIGYAAWSRNQPPAQRAALARGEHFLDRFAGRAFALSLGVYALVNLQASFGFLKRKQPAYAAFWFLFAAIQILLVIGIFVS
jgi:hypothetical protein